MVMVKIDGLLLPSNIGVLLGQIDLDVKPYGFLLRNKAGSASNIKDSGAEGVPRGSANFLEARC
jgi:hypothetical protein